VLHVPSDPITAYLVAVEDISPSYNYLFGVLETGQKDPTSMGCCTVQSSSSSVTFGYLRTKKQNNKGNVN